MAQDEPRKGTWGKPDGVEPVDLLIRQVQSPLYRGIHVNGAMGNYNQAGEMYVALFSERQANRENIGMRLTPDGASREIPVENPGTPGFIREIEIGVFMSMEAAESLGLWLLSNVERYRTLKAEAEAEIEAEGGTIDNGPLSKAN